MKYINETFMQLIKGRSLTEKSIYRAMCEIMKNKVSPVKLAGWLTALALKEESSSEIAGAAKAMREHMIKIKNPFCNTIDIVGTGGDGKNTINISTAAAFVAAGAGIPVAKHGNRSASGKSGSADVLQSMGIDINLSPEQMAKSLKQNKITFLFAPLMHPAMKYAVPVRKELGIRTIFNLLGPLCNPAEVKRMVLGVFRRNLAAIMAEALYKLKIEHAVVVYGHGGMDEVSLTGKSLIYEIKNKNIRKYYFSPESLGIPLADLKEIEGGNPQENAEIIKSVFSGKLPGPKRNIILLNAAFGIYVSGKTNRLDHALKIAEHSLESGAALQKIQDLTTYSS